MRIKIEHNDVVLLFTGVSVVQPEIKIVMRLLM